MTYTLQLSVKNNDTGKAKGGRFEIDQSDQIMRALLEVTATMETEMQERPW